MGVASVFHEMERALPKVDRTSVDSGKPCSAVQASVLKALAYFDNFQYPLRVDEIVRFGSSVLLCPTMVRDALEDLRKKSVVYECDGFWGLTKVKEAVSIRRSAEDRAEARMPKALKMSRRIGRFPFVRAVFISGSMSKGCLAPDGDIDFFVITTPGRLWVARTMLILYKKVFLLNSRKDFCVNYFIDTDHLTIEDRNRFTATEVITLMPMYGNGTTEAFFQRNAWAFRMHPGASAPRSREVLIGKGSTKGILERLLSGRIGERLDGLFMELTWRRWKRKFDDLDARSFELALRTRTYVSKHHPRNFQKRVLDGYQQRIHTLEKSIGAPLT